MKTILGILASTALAATLHAAPLVSCASISVNGKTTYGQLLQAGGCQDQDKQYTGWSGNLPSNTVVGISTVTGLIDSHIVNIGALGIGAYSLAYVISIDPLVADYALRNITSVTLGFDSAGVPGNQAQKLVYAGGTPAGALLATLTSSGVPTTSGSFQQKSLYISETINVTNTAYQSTTNSFTQELSRPPDIPEPTTNALIGCGLVGLVFLKRRKRLSA